MYCTELKVELTFNLKVVEDIDNGIETVQHMNITRLFNDDDIVASLKRSVDHPDWRYDKGDQGVAFAVMSSESYGNFIKMLPGLPIPVAAEVEETV